MHICLFWGILCKKNCLVIIIIGTTRDNHTFLDMKRNCVKVVIAVYSLMELVFFYLAMQFQTPTQDMLYERWDRNHPWTIVWEVGVGRKSTL